jgi:hypothetical protein
MTSLVLAGNTSGTLTIDAPDVAGTSVLNLPASSGTILDDASVGVCRAWVNFNGTGTVAIRASFNVSGITDIGTGNYTVNFTNAMPDANYSTVATTGGTTARITLNSPISAGGEPTTTSTSIVSYIDSASAASDSRFVNVAIFR